MTTFAERLDAAAGAATCQVLSQFGSSLVGYAGWSLFAGGPVTVPLTLGAAALLASNYGCSWNTAGTPTLTGAGPIGDMCWKTAGSFRIDRYKDGVFVGAFINDIREIKSSVFKSSSGGYTTYTVTYISSANGATLTGEYYVGADSNGLNVNTIRQTFISGTCTANGPGSADKPSPYTYTDTGSGCQMKVTWQGLVTEPDGTPRPVYLIEQTGPISLASGGIIGGCNFQPVVYVGRGNGGGGKPPSWGPYGGSQDPDGYGRPWWVEPAERILAGVTQAVISELIRRLITPQVAGKVYRLVSVCETNANGEPISQSREVDIPAQPLLQAAIYRLDAIEYLLQGLKDFKQPICPPTRFTRQGEPVTVRFQSDEQSDFGNRRLDKRFVYLDQSAAPLETHSLHWANFTWQSGPVCVIHKGAPWGVPKVWAASVEEGKRVIRHAGQVAGVDPDSEGEWIVTGTADQRIGQIKTMRVMRRAGALCVSKRLGASGLPLLMVEPPAS